MLFRKQNVRYNVTLWPKISIEGSDYNPDRTYTIFITHGFNSDGENQWMLDLKDAYLEQVINQLEFSNKIRDYLF